MVPKMEQPCLLDRLERCLLGVAAEPAPWDAPPGVPGHMVVPPYTEEEAQNKAKTASSDKHAAPTEVWLDPQGKRARNSWGRDIVAIMPTIFGKLALEQA